MIVSITRLRLNHLKNLRPFFKLAYAAIAQAKEDAECLAVGTYIGPGLTFWTATAWTNEPSMKKYVRSGSHQQTLPQMAPMCTEAATYHIEVPHMSDRLLPMKSEIAQKMKDGAKFYRVAAPTSAHEAKIIPNRKPWYFRRFK